MWWLGAVAALVLAGAAGASFWRQAPRQVWALEQKIGYPLQIPASMPQGLALKEAVPVAGAGNSLKKVALVAYQGRGQALYLLESPLPLALPGGQAQPDGLLYHGTPRMKQALVHARGEYVLLDGVGLSRGDILSVAAHLKPADGGIAFAVFHRIHPAN